VIAQGKVPGLSKQTDLFMDGLGHAKKPLENMASYRKFSSTTLTYRITDKEIVWFAALVY
jgi:hypothetical protein